jgi:hypothetical protein
MMEQDVAPASGGKRISPRSGGAGAPPEDITIPCQGLADGGPLRRFVRKRGPAP